MSEADLPIVDPHQHFWDLERNYYPWLCDARPIAFRYGDYSALKRSYLPRDYIADAGSNRVVKTVHVEAEWDPRDPLGETRWLEQLTATHGLPSAYVVQAWLDRDDVETVLAAQAARPLVRGIRHKPKAASAPEHAVRGAPGSMDDRRWRHGFAMLERYRLSFDLQTPWWHFEAAAELARDFPTTLLIINHTGLPSDRSPEGIAGWRRALDLVAQEPNTRLKISGIGVPGKSWTVVLNGQVVRDAISIFGASRAMFASNFPVDRLFGTYTALWNAYARIVGDASDSEKQALFVGNAQRIYRI